MSVFLHPLALILQRALTTLGLRLGRAFRRRPRQLPVHLETQAGGSPSELAVVRQSEPPTPTLGRSIAAFCTAGAAERLSAADHNENCREHDFLQAPELVSCCSEDFEETGWLMAPVREERRALSTELVIGFYFSTSMPD